MYIYKWWHWDLIQGGVEILLVQTHYRLNSSTVGWYLSIASNEWPTGIAQGKYSEYFMQLITDFQVENILRSDRGDFVLCDYGSATRKVVYPQVSLKHGNTGITDNELWLSTRKQGIKLTRKHV